MKRRRRTSRRGMKGAKEEQKEKQNKTKRNKTKRETKQKEKQNQARNQARPGGLVFRSRRRCTLKRVSRTTNYVFIHGGQRALYTGSNSDIPVHTTTLFTHLRMLVTARGWLPRLATRSHLLAALGVQSTVYRLFNERLSDAFDKSVHPVEHFVAPRGRLRSTKLTSPLGTCPPPFQIDPSHDPYVIPGDALSVAPTPQQGDPGERRAEWGSPGGSETPSQHDSRCGRGPTLSDWCVVRIYPRFLCDASRAKGERSGESGELDKAVRKGEGSLGCLAHPCRYRHRRTRTTK
eukprot:1175752-Prorocentrum_minimum.AAC.1